MLLTYYSSYVKKICSFFILFRLYLLTSSLIRNAFSLPCIFHRGLKQLSLASFSLWHLYLNANPFCFVSTLFIYCMVDPAAWWPKPIPKIMGVLTKSWCFCKGEGKSESMKATIFTNKASAMARMSLVILGD